MCSGSYMPTTSTPDRMVLAGKPAILISKLILSRLRATHYYIRFANSTGFGGFDKRDNKNKARKP
jgi:hypothetical protein